jgi:hypothetical protein
MSIHVREAGRERKRERGFLPDRKLTFEIFYLIFTHGNDVGSKLVMICN